MNENELEENAVLDRHEPSWIAQGYRVVRQPRGTNLPAFLRTHAPDAVLLGRTPNVVVEVLRKGQTNVERKVRDLRALVAGQDDWRLEVLYAGEEPEQLPQVSTEQLKELLEKVRNFAPVEQRGALLLLWAIVEALARRLEPDKTRRPQSAERVVELLAGAGHIAPSQAERLREAARLRNLLVHGDLNISLSEEQVLRLADLVGDMIGVLAGREAGWQAGPD